jgi:hypothetical protein
MRCAEFNFVLIRAERIVSEYCIRFVHELSMTQEKLHKHK